MNTKGAKHDFSSGLKYFVSKKREGRQQMKNEPVKISGIETSRDETAAAAKRSASPIVFERSALDASAN